MKTKGHPHPMGAKRVAEGTCRPPGAPTPPPPHQQTQQLQPGLLRLTVFQWGGEGGKLSLCSVTSPLAKGLLPFGSAPVPLPLWGWGRVGAEFAAPGHSSPGATE